LTTHTCTICGRKLECNDNGELCDMPEFMVINCGVETGHPYHEEEYCKVVGIKL